MNTNTNTKQVIVFTDGACEPNPGPGGYGAVLKYGGIQKNISGGYRKTTNNRMEIIAAIKALENLIEPSNVILFSDSKYLVETMDEGKAVRWKANDWYQTKKKRAVNADLWNTLLNLCETHVVSFKWVKGHSGDPGNELADKLSYAALIKTNLAVDIEYEKKFAYQTKNTASIKQTQNYNKKARTKIVKEGQPCRKCSVPVIKKIPKRKRKEGQTYYFEYYFYCPNCKTMYMVEDAKRDFNKTDKLF